MVLEHQLRVEVIEKSQVGYTDNLKHTQIMMVISKKKPGALTTTKWVGSRQFILLKIRVQVSICS
jgi:hypothetical protein